MPSETINGITLAYEDGGAGLPVVLLHGYPLDSRMWANQIGSLSARYRVIAPDLRGFGKSPSIEPFTIEQLADDVHALLAKRDALPAVLGGFSMGGYVALALAKKYPSDLRALILVDTRAEADTTEGKAAREKAIDLVRQGGAEAIADQMLPKLLVPEDQRRGPKVTNIVRGMIEAQPPLTIEHALRAMRDRADYTEMLPSVAVPTLIVVGEKDALTPPAMSRAMHERIPRSQLAIIPEAAHLAPMENPDDVGRALHDFLRSLKSDVA
jgi:pimeloyl-ACP methyl ester carboxylesterase